MQYYIQEKAKKFLQSGYLLYRNQDFFHLPPVDISPEEHQALYDICGQIVEDKGFQSHYPVIASLEHIRMFVEMMHFQITLENEELIQIQHIINKHQPEFLYCIFTKTNPSKREPFHFSWKKEEVVHPMYPLVSYQPMLISSRMIKSGVIGDCWYQLHVDCKVNSSIQYQSLLLCIDPHRHQPCFIVSEEIGLDCLFFCSFDEEGHHNFGECDFETVDEFFAMAMPLIKTFLEETIPEYPSPRGI
ncbi:MAG: hypothetical protein CL916_12090 [Deltaproteobacteria bacterium]|nr:hypothetical protein [Deltaproteobacteria bacterium]